MSNLNVDYQLQVCKENKSTVDYFISKVMKINKLVAPVYNTIMCKTGLGHWRPKRIATKEYIELNKGLAILKGLKV